MAFNRRLSIFAERKQHLCCGGYYAGYQCGKAFTGKIGRRSDHITGQYNQQGANRAKNSILEFVEEKFERCLSEEISGLRTEIIERTSGLKVELTAQVAAMKVN
ncbi:MAG: hypothetical protein H6695_09115 [Deferribacteres bacterium]|nr:hypothetical protein [candidate division KSB1 bacterium]MCB9510330.1 hypothetical protein [Deferribacteres bacterium]